MLPCQQLELAAQRCEAASLDLDQQVAADEIDDETADDLFDAIAGALVPVVELSVQRTLVERPIAGISASWDAATSRTERTMTLLLRRGAVAFARSPARHGRHQHRREKNDHLPRYRGPRSGVRPVARAVAGSGCRGRAERRQGRLSRDCGGGALLEWVEIR